MIFPKKYVWRGQLEWTTWNCKIRGRRWSATAFLCVSILLTSYFPSQTLIPNEKFSCLITNIIIGSFIFPNCENVGRGSKSLRANLWSFNCVRPTASNFPQTVSVWMSQHDVNQLIFDSIILWCLCDTWCPVGASDHLSQTSGQTWLEKVRRDTAIVLFYILSRQFALIQFASNQERLRLQTKVKRTISHCLETVWRNNTKEVDVLG